MGESDSARAWGAAERARRLSVYRHRTPPPPPQEKSKNGGGGAGRYTCSGEQNDVTQVAAS